MFERKSLDRGWKILVYGKPGIGKTTLASYAEKPAFIDLEDGLVHLDVLKTDYIESHQMYMKALREAATNEDIKTVVIDTIDGLEKIITNKICKDDDKESLADFGYGRGYELLMSEFNKQCDIFDKIVRRGKNLLIVAHEMVKKYEDPTSEPYDRYMIKVHQKSSQVLSARMDAILFCDYQKIVKKNSTDENMRAIGQGERVVFTQEKPSFVAKNRFDLPEKMKMDRDIFENIDTFFNKHNKPEV